MHIAQPKFANAALRRSLKRGLARQALVQAEEADLARMFHMTSDLAPNRKARERGALRLAGMRGVVRVGIVAEGIVAVMRNRREVTTRVGQTDVFTEDALLYTRVVILPGRLGTAGYLISRASFCLHALERLVERSPVALDGPLLPQVDIEALAVLRGFARARLIADGDDHFVRASGQGVWAGSVDVTGLEPDWNLAYAKAEVAVTVFSARTFLSPDEMRPTVWARWQNDPHLSVR